MIVAILLNRGVIQAVLVSGDITLSSAAATYQLDEPVDLHAELAFPDQEEATVSGVELIIERTTPTSTQTTVLHVFLPLNFSTTSSSTTETVDLSDPTIAPVGNGTLVVTTTFDGVEETTSGTLPDTLPPTTLPGIPGGKFKGLFSGPNNRIEYDIEWTPPEDPVFVGDYTVELKVHVVSQASIPGIVPNQEGLVPFSIEDTVPAAKVVTITSEGEAMGLDQFFLVVAGTDQGSSEPPLTVSVSGAIITTTTMQTIDTMPAILRKMHGLDKVRANPATHVMLAQVPGGQPQGDLVFEFDITYPSAPLVETTAVLPVVGARSNRNYFLQPGTNFTGLGVIPNDPSLVNQLKQAAPNVNPAFQDMLGGPLFPADLADVVDTVFAFGFNNTFTEDDFPPGPLPVSNPGGWLYYGTPDPLAGGSAIDGGLTVMEPYQGMIFKTREKVTSVDVFEMVDVAGFVDKKPVPIKMTVSGPFLDTGDNPQLPPTKQLRVGWNLVAPHIEEDVSFELVYQDAVVPIHIATRALSFIRQVDAVESGPDVVAEIVSEFALATFNALIRPQFSYWTRINEFFEGVSGSETLRRPILTPAGAD